jgi:hypothetical protein
MCQRPATSKEHIPPKCLFPEARDSPSGVDYRKNLITVPSCEAHNSAKSKDDEYLLMVVLTHFENNLAAQRQFSQKGIRALWASPSLHNVFANRIPARVDGRETIVFTVNRERFDSSIGHIASGLCFHHFGLKQTAKWHVHSQQLLLADMDKRQVDHTYARMQKKLREEVASKLATVPIQGTNPEVFQYQLLQEPSSGPIIVCLLFYEGLEVIAVSYGTKMS